MLKIKEEMGQIQAKMLKDAEISTDKNIEKAVIKAQLKQQKADQEKAEKLALNLASIQAHRMDQLKKNEHQKQSEKNEDKYWLNKYKTEAEAFEAGNNARKSKNLDEALKLQAFHRDQIVSMQTLTLHDIINLGLDDSRPT